MTDITVPDGIEPIRAYRGWRVQEWRGLTRLRSLVQLVDWPAHMPVTAKCMAIPGASFGVTFMSHFATFTSSSFTLTSSEATVGGHTASKDETPEQLAKRLENTAPHPNPPHTACGCGFWGVADPWKIRAYDGQLPSLSVVVGVVELWGRVVVGTEGWRGQYARPVALVGTPKYPGRTRKQLRALARAERRIAEQYDIPVFDYWPDITSLEAS